MLVLGLVLILFAIWINIATNTLPLKPLGFAIGVVGVYLILKQRKRNNN